MKNLVILIFITISICLFGCKRPSEGPNYHPTIRVTNLLDKPIYLFGQWIWPGEPQDPIEPQYAIILNDSKANRVAPGETNSEALRTHNNAVSYEGMMKNGTKMRIYYIDGEELDKYSSWQEVPEGLVIETRMYTLEELRTLDFWITYP